MKRVAALLAFCAAFTIGVDAHARNCAVTGNGQRVVDAVTTSGSPNVASAKALFQSGDVGKTVILMAADGTNLLPGNLATIITFTNSSHVVLSANATANSTGATMVWATGTVTSAMNAAVASCKAPAATDYPVGGTFAGAGAGTVTLDGGNIFDGCLYDVNVDGSLPAVMGSGQTKTMLFAAPTLTPCADGPLIAYARGQDFAWGGMTIECNNHLQTGGAPFIRTNQLATATFSDFAMRNCGADSIDSSVLSLENTTFVSMKNVVIQASPPGAKSYQCQFGVGAASFDNVWCSNGFRDVHWISGAARKPTTIGTLWRVAGSDECGDPLHWCTVLEANTELQAIGITVFGTIRLEPGASLYITNGNMGAFNAFTAIPAADVAPGATIYSLGTTWRANGFSKAVNNGGDFIDLGGNTWQSCTSTTCIPQQASQSFNGNLPVRR